MNGLRPWKPARALYICKSDNRLNTGRNQNEENWTKTKMDESNSNDEYCKFSLTDTHEYRDNKKSVIYLHLNYLNNLFTAKSKKQVP